MNLYIWKENIPKSIIMFSYSIIILITLIVNAGLLNTVSSTSQIPQNLGEVSIKFKYFTEHKDDYNVIFFGPSTTYYGVIPKIFDDFMGKEGQKIKSFNLGISGANVSEADFYLKKILALKPANLKWIFIDPRIDFFTFSPSSAKEIYWHTPRKTIENMKLIMESNHPWQRKIRYAYYNFQSFLYHYFGIGQLSGNWQGKILKSDLSKSQALEDVSEERLIKESGYYAIDWKQDIEEWKKDFYLRFLDNYQEDLLKAKSKKFQQENQSANVQYFYGMKMIEDMVSQIDRQSEIDGNKIKPIFFIPPNLSFDNNNAVIKAYNLGYIPVLFAFNNPQIFSNLYELDRRIDREHLSYQGAQEFTLSLAEKFSQYIHSAEPISISQN